MRSFLLVLCACVLNACAPAWQKPEIRLAEIRLAGGSILQQKLRLQLRVNNPNGMDIGVEHLAFDLMVGENRVGSGQSLAPATIPKRGEAVLEVEAKANVLGLLARLPELTAVDGKLHYRLKGEARITHYGSAPFDQAGSLELGKLKGLGVPQRKADPQPEEIRL